MGKIGILMGMKVTATMLANDSKGILDDVIYRGASAVIQRHGKPVAEIRRKPGISRAELVRRMKDCPFTKKETAEFRQLIKTANQVYANGH
jgi:hypothetical protein